MRMLRGGRLALAAAFLSLSLGCLNTVSNLVYGTPPASPVNVGQTWPAFTVKLLNKLGEVPDDPNVTQVSIVQTGGGGTLSGTLTRTAAQGIATFDDLSYNQAGVVTFDVTAGGVGSIVGTQVIVVGGPPVAVSLSFGTPPSSPQGAGLPWGAFTVEVRDSTGALVAGDNGRAIALTETGDSSFSGTITRNTVGGVATFNDISYPDIESILVGATSLDLLPAESVAVSVNHPLAPAQLRFRSAPNPFQYAGYTWNLFTVDVLDSLGNLVTTDNGRAITITEDGPGSFGGTTVRYTSAGGVLFNNLSYNTAGTFNVNATSPGLSSPAAVTVTVNPTPVATSLIFGTPPASPQTPGVPWNTFTVQVRDQYGYVLTTESGRAITITEDGAGSFSGAITKSTASGVAVFSGITYSSGGVINVGATSGALTPAAPASVLMFVPNAAPVATNPGPVSVNEDGSVGITLTGTDAEDPVTSLVVDVTVPPLNGDLDALSGFAPLGVTYTPDPNYFGSDSFQFTVTDTEFAVSTPVTVSITVNGVNDPPNGVIDTPVGNVTINVGQSVNFNSTCIDIDNNTPFTHLWDFSGGAANSAMEDPGAVTFNSLGIYGVVYACSDSESLLDLTPPTLTITVVNPPVQILSFNALPSIVDLDASSIISWTTEAATSCSINQGIGSLGNGELASGNRIVTTLFRRTYMMTCQGFGGPVTAQVTVGVIPYWITTNSNGRQGSGADSEASSISRDGNWIAFESAGGGLVLDDNNGAIDIFVKNISTGSLIRASTDSFGNEGSGNSRDAIISANGRYVVFYSFATNLVSGDTNGVADVFWKDLENGTTLRISTDSNGAQAMGCPLPVSIPCSNAGGISADGRYVVFSSSASNLVAGDFDGALDGFLKDMQTGETKLIVQNTSAGLSQDGLYAIFTTSMALIAGDTNGQNDAYLKNLQDGSVVRVSTDSAGGQANGASSFNSISLDSRYVAFSSVATNLVPADTNGTWDVFVKDLFSGVTIRASTTASGSQVVGDSRRASISGDGRYVAFLSSASTLVVGDTNLVDDVFWKDLQSGVIQRVNVSTSGVEADYDAISMNVSNDGQRVAFSTYASNLVPIDATANIDVFLRDITAGTTVLQNTNSAGERPTGGQNLSLSASADGRLIVFSSQMIDLIANDDNRNNDVFLKNLDTGITTLISSSAAGILGNSSSEEPSISSDGRYVAFVSYANNLVAGPMNVWRDIFVKNLNDGSIVLASASSAGTPGNSTSINPSLSSDGGYVAFSSAASNLVASDISTYDVFKKNLATGAIEKVSVSTSGIGGNADSFMPSISSTGRYVVFYSSATNLVSSDTNAIRDLFIRDTMLASTMRVNTSSTGTQSNGLTNAGYSRDGRYVFFSSIASNLVTGDTNGKYDIFRKDMQTNAIVRLSTTATGGQIFADSLGGCTTLDGRYMSFMSDASNLVSGDTNNAADGFVKDLQTGAIMRISINASGVQGNNGSSACIAENGQYVIYSSNASNLVVGDAGTNLDFFVIGNPFLP
ncbi:MAG: Ig-like domain-containing protein [Bdellovibrionota bacterium]